MNKPGMIRDFFDKIEKVTTAPVAPSVPTPVYAATVEPPAAPTAEAANVQTLEQRVFSYIHSVAPIEEHNPDCPPLTSHKKGTAAKVSFDDFGVGLPPMAGSYN